MLIVTSFPHISHPLPLSQPRCQASVHPQLTILGDHRTLLCHCGVLAEATHVFSEDPEVVLVPYDQLGDGGIGTVVVLDDREPFLRGKVMIIG